MGQRDEVPPLVEPIPVPTVFVSGVVLEDIEGCFIITGFSTQRSPVDGTLERKIETRIATTRDYLVKMMEVTAKATGFALGCPLEQDKGKMLERKH